MLKTFVHVLIAAVIGGTGHVMLSKGMKLVGDLTEAPADRLAGMVGRAVSNPWLLTGVALQATFFFLYLTLLSRANVSLVLPLTAIDYIVVALLAQFLLAEPVTPTRWAGIGLIVAGVLLVSRS
jgi:drug/metabolite transporter (DMT)-like permease